MKILILGATGRTGKWTVDLALKRGHTVHAIVRNKNKLNINSKDLILFEGVPTDKELLKKASNGCSAILSTLNIARTSDFPWANLRTPKTFLSDVMNNLIEISNTQNIKRAVICSAWGVHETKAEIPAWFKWLINNSNIGVAYKDHEVQEALVKASDLDWTIVRPVGLTNSKNDKETQVTLNNNPKPRLTISRQNVAKFMIDAIENNSYIKQTPVISDK